MRLEVDNQVVFLYRHIGLISISKETVNKALQKRDGIVVVCQNDEMLLLPDDLNRSIKEEDDMFFYKWNPQVIA